MEIRKLTDDELRHELQATRQHIKTAKEAWAPSGTMTLEQAERRLLEIQEECERRAQDARKLALWRGVAR